MAVDVAHCSVPGSVGGGEQSVTTSSNPSAATTAVSAHVEVAPARADVSLLLDEVDRLVQRHHADLARCFDDWLRSRDSPEGPLQLNAGPVATGGWCSDRLSSGEPVRAPPCSEPAELRVNQPWSSVMPTTSRGVDSKGLAKEVAESKRRRKKPKKNVQELLHPTETLEQRSKLQRITRSRAYEWFSGSLVLLNGVFIGWQTQDLATTAEANAVAGRPQDTSIPAGFLAIQVLFALAFVVELGLRWVAEGFIHFFSDSDVWWNVLDVLVVSLSVLDLLLFAMISDPDGGDVLGNVSMLRVMRVVRVVRVARVIRVLKFFRELRMMVFSILGSLKSLLWVIVILVMTFFIFGITFTSAATAEVESGAAIDSTDFQELRANFGTLDRSILSLFMAMSGGDDWVRFYRSLTPLPAQYRLLFLIYITFAVFGVVNIVTGVFVESAMQNSLSDKDVVVHEEMEAKKEYLRSMQEVFDEMDENNTGFISLAEFEKQLDDERVIAYFHALKLDVSDAQTLFRLLDFDGSNEVNIDEFLTGCYRLQGESRSLDMKIMQCEVQFMQEAFLSIIDMQKQLLARHGIKVDNKYTDMYRSEGPLSARRLSQGSHSVPVGRA